MFKFPLFFLVLSTVFSDDQKKELVISVENAFPDINFKQPIQLCFPRTHPSTILLVLQEGKILSLPASDENKVNKTVLDWTDRNMVEKNFEEGLLGLAFHPYFDENGLIYLYHTMQKPKRSVLTELRVLLRSPQITIDPEYERKILTIRQPYWNHNSGIPCFGPDGYLYISTGDGGKANDPHKFSQNTFSLLGKVLRIDVDNASEGNQYGIPVGNPFVNRPGFLPEIWAYGLRNPWRLSWDHVSGSLFCADVGQNKLEEVNLIEKGGNYGWSSYEGSHLFELNDYSDEAQQVIKPIFEYSHDYGTSITGGFVYRGKKHKEIEGKYIFGDWGTGKCWALSFEKNQIYQQNLLFQKKGVIINPSLTEKRERNFKPFKPVNFQAGPNGEIYVLDWQGSIYRSS